MNITKALEKDYEEVCELFRRLDQHHADIIPERIRSHSEHFRSLEQYLSYISAGDRVLFVAEEEGVCVGVASLAIVEILEHETYVARLYAHLDNMYVVPEHRNTGVASSLIGTSLEWCRERRVPKLELQVYNANVEALKAYKALGFHEYLTKMELQVNA